MVLQLFDVGLWDYKKELANITMAIPKIVHQTWKDENIPKKFRYAVETVKRYHPDWEYRLWTDKDIDLYVRANHAEFYPIFISFSRHIMRVDTFRYLLMLDIGGLYVDLDYEFLRPYAYPDVGLLLSRERDVSYGDGFNSVSNYIIASRPGHPFWQHIYQEMLANPAVTDTYLDVLASTGPGFLSKHFFELQERERWPDVMLTPRPTFSPHRLHGKNEKKILLNSSLTYGFHIGAGTWKQRLSFEYLKTKARPRHEIC